MAGVGLTEERIVGAALALCAEHGPEALSMRRLGAALGCDASAVYRHVRSKQALLDAVTDRLIDAVQLPPLDADPWQDLRVLTLAVRHAVLASPRLAPLVAARPPLGPGAQRIVDRLLTSLAAAGLAPREAARALQLLVTLTLGTLGDLTRVDGERGQERQREVTRALRAGQQAGSRVAQVAPLLGRNDDPEQFAYAVEIVLAGLRARTDETQ